VGVPDSSFQKLDQEIKNLESILFDIKWIFFGNSIAILLTL
jgi:hypothetical protein